MNGNRAIIEQFLADGITCMFGNPGTVEQGFLDALAEYPRMKYVLTLQESVAVLAADGYARATKRPALVQIHSSPGLGNAIGALYQAKRGHSPLVVIGGDAGVKYQAMDAQMAADLVAMAEPVTKWATCVNDPSSLLRVLRRAVKIAATPPMGPVYVCLPLDILDCENTGEIIPTQIPSTRTSPDDETIERAASMLASGKTPMFFVGDGIAYSGAQDEVVEVAKLLGAEIWECNNGEVNCDTTHYLYQGATGHMFGAQSLPVLRKGDVNLVCGTYIVPEVFPELGNVFAPGAKVVHFDLDGYEIGKNHPVTIGSVTDPKPTLEKLAAALREKLTPTQKRQIEKRKSAIKSATKERIEKQRASYEAYTKDAPLHMYQFASKLAEAVGNDPNLIIFDEALTNSPPLMFCLPPQRSEQYFLTRGGSLGVGFPGAIGLKLAFPNKTVIAFSGDGGSMYTIQALWTAARHNLDVKFVVCNNRSYRLLQLNINAYWKERNIAAHGFPLCFDLSKPAMDFVKLGEAMGVPGCGVGARGEIEPAIKAMLSAKGPFLIDLGLEGEVHPELIGVRCGQ
jgi:thiamine pyrophosphate-dependent acetolactate synthase large subunit-like protein